MKYWEVEFECDNSWSMSGIYSFFMRKETEPTIEDIKDYHGVYPNHNGLGNIANIYDITDELNLYEEIPDEWYEEWLVLKKQSYKEDLIMDNRRVLQIGLDIVVGSECDGYDLTKEVLAELTKRGFTVVCAGFKGDVTSQYPEHYLDEITD